MAHPKLTLVVTVSILAGCAAIGSIEFDRRYGEEVFGGRGDGKGSEFVRY